MMSPSAADPEKASTESPSVHRPEALHSEDVAEAKLLRKIDMKVLPYISVMYLFAFLDRVNISNAVLFSLQKDLKINSTQYSTALMIFFVSYVAFEIPSNVILKRLKPHVWLSICMFGFGIVTILQGLAQGYSGILAARFFLGFFEAGMFPGAFYLLSMWYRREESQKRFTFFFGSTSLAGGFGGLLAAAIGKLDGFRGYHGWRWIFIFEGLLTAVVGIALFFLLPDFPEDVKFLTPAERECVRLRLKADVGESDHHVKLTVSKVAAVFKDYKVFLGGMMYMGLILAAYGYAFFAPTILRGFGYGIIETQLRSVPPAAASFVFSMIVAYFSDRIRHRFLFALGSSLIALSGYAAMLAYPASIQARYGVLFLVTCGLFSAMPVVICWFGSNLAGHVRRSTGIAFQITCGQVAGIISVYLFPASDAPKYTTGFATSIAFVCLSMVATTAYFASLVVENRRRDRLLAEKGGYENDENEMGDLSPRHRYLL